MPEYIPKSSRSFKEYPTKGQLNEVIYDNNPTSSVLKTNNQDLSHVKYTFNDINAIYEKFLYNQNSNKVLVIKKPEHIRRTLPDGAIIEDRWIDKTLIVENIIPSEEKYFPQNINKNLINPPPLYLTVYYYDNMDSLASIANGVTVEPFTTILPYRINMNINETDKPQKYDNEIPYPNEGTEYNNGFFIHNYIEQHESGLISQYNKQKNEASRKSPLRGQNIRENNKILIQKQKPTSSDLIKKYGSAAAAFVAIIAVSAASAAFIMSSSQNGGEVFNPESDLSKLSEKERKDLLDELKDKFTEKELTNEMDKLSPEEKEALNKEVEKYFPGFTFEKRNETVFGNLFGANGGKRKRTNKKRRTNKRRNNKKKSNRRYTDKV